MYGLRSVTWIEEDHTMQKPEPIIVPPMAHIPQVPPQIVAIQRRVYVPPTLYRQANQMRQPATPLQFSPLAQLHRPNRSAYIPPEIRYAPATEPSSWLSRSLPETPRPFPLTCDTGQFASIQKTPTTVFRPATKMSMPSALPHSLVGYNPSSVRRPDPGVAETLMGCATLFILGIVVLTVLYYLALK